MSATRSSANPPEQPATTHDAAGGRLFVGPLPSDFEPDRDVPFAPWCLLGASLDPTEMERWPWKTNPYDSHEAKLAMADASHDQVRFWAHRLGERFDGRGPGSSKRNDYWEFVLAPWLTAFLTTMMDCGLRINLLRRHYPNHHWVVCQSQPTSDDKAATTREFSDFIKTGRLQVEFTRAILGARDLNFEVRDIDGHTGTSDPNDSARTPKAVRARGWKSTVMRLSRFFERSGPVLSVRGFTPLDTLWFGVLLQFTRLCRDGCEVPPAPPEPDFAGIGLPREAVLRLLLEHQPSRVVEAAMSRRSHSRFAWRRYLVGNYINDDSFRLKVARARLLDRDVIGVQHGWNTGMLAREVKTRILEYRLSRFATWGAGSANGQAANFLPLPCPFLKLREPTKPRRNRIMLIGKQQALIPTVIDARPVPEENWEYRQDKLKFLGELSEEVRSVTSYRPYEREMGCLDDGAFVQRHYPEVEIVAGAIGKGGLLGSDLLVFDRFGTANSLALACDRPFVAFYRQEEYVWSEWGERYVTALEELGLLFKSPVEAAREVERVWPRLEEWWSEPSRRKGVVLLREEYGHWRSDWRRLWFRALKEDSSQEPLTSSSRRGNGEKMAA